MTTILCLARLRACLKNYHTEEAKENKSHERPSAITHSLTHYLSFSLCLSLLSAMPVAVTVTVTMAIGVVAAKVNDHHVALCWRWAALGRARPHHTRGSSSARASTSASLFGRFCSSSCIQRCAFLHLSLPHLPVLAIR